MAAIGAIATMLKSGDHVVVTDNTYGGTFRLFERVLRRYELTFTYVDTSCPERVEQAMTANTRMLFVETPTNPMLRLADLELTARIAHAHGARMIVDNTFASPYVQRPIDTGTDLVVHSTTKFLNGHSDSVGGIVVATRDDDIEWLKFVQNAEGAILGPFDSWLVLRGTKTLPLRMIQPQCQRPGPGGVSRRAPEGALELYPGSRLTRSTRWRSARCGDLAGWSRSIWDRSRRRGACSTACACSRSPRAWAASRRSSRTPRR